MLFFNILFGEIKQAYSIFGLKIEQNALLNHFW